MRIKGNGYLHRQFVVLVTLVVIVSVLAACSRSEPPATSPVAVSEPRPTIAAMATPPTSGGAIKLNGNLPEGGNVSEQYQVSANGSHVVYIADAGTNDIDELYSVPLA